MGNNPVSLVDPDGRFSTRSEARQFRRDENIGGIFNIRSTSTGDFYIKDGQTSWYHGYGIKGGFSASVSFMSGVQSQGGGNEFNPLIPASIAVGGGFVGGSKDSYKYGSHNVKYAQRINGKVLSASELSKAYQLHAAKMASGLKVVGGGVTVFSVAASGYQFLNSDMSGNDYARMTGSFIITGTAFIPKVGPVISIGLGVADSYGAFDGIYNYFD
jgi:hypothetical protein